MYKRYRNSIFSVKLVKYSLRPTKQRLEREKRLNPFNLRSTPERMERERRRKQKPLIITEWLKQYLWNKLRQIRGKDKNLYRLDRCNNQIQFELYGSFKNEGWNVDHKKPQAKFGTHNMNNLQALRSKTNSSKGCQYPYKYPSKTDTLVNV